MQLKIKYGLEVVSLGLFIFTCYGSARAVDVPHFSIKSLKTTGDTTLYQVQADTAGKGVSAVEVFAVLPTGESYVSTNTANSKFETTITDSEFVHGQVHLVRASIKKDGISGADVPVAEFSISGKGGTPTINIVDSKMITYVDSIDLLHPPTPKPITHPTDKKTTTNLAMRIVIGVIILGGAVGSVLFKQRQLGKHL